MILQQAAEYKEKKRQRELERATEEQQPKPKTKGSPKKVKKQARSLE